MNKDRYIKLLTINSLVFFSFIFGIELFLGNWLRGAFMASENVQIPNLLKDIEIKYDVRWIYSSTKPLVVKYNRDKNGYRSKYETNEKKIILTIGGSTTDERFVTEGETWQDNLDKEFPKYDFINGGVDGQSSFGHVQSIRFWHSKALESENVEAVLFYVGINDRHLLENNLNMFDTPQFKKDYVKNLLMDNSFFFKKTYSLKQKLDFLFDLNRKNYDLLSTYNSRKKDFLKKGIIYELDEEFDFSKYLFYKKIFKSLIFDTRKYFPKSKILLIQQQIPGCNFISEKVVSDRHPSKNSNYCIDLLKVYQIQNEIIKDLEIDNFEVFPMYLKSVLEDGDIYDYIHTNKKGSKKFSNYLKTIFNNFENF